MKVEPPRATNTDTKAHKTTESKASQKSDTKHIVFFSYVGEENGGTQLNKGGFRAKSTTEGQGGDTHGSILPENKNPQLLRGTQSVDPNARNPQES